MIQINPKSGCFIVNSLANIKITSTIVGLAHMYLYNK